VPEVKDSKARVGWGVTGKRGVGHRKGRKHAWRRVRYMPPCVAETDPSLPASRRCGWERRGADR
ncbi:MAG TPA: hypothetical protein PKM95_10445, partial [Deltaproteobacteria bacterium]|nr:hypothetical protein [Deltaproteobacteria bacterium]